MVSRKCELESNSLNGQHIAIEYTGGKIVSTVGDIKFSRLIGGSCAFSPESETAYCFGGIYEKIAPSSEESEIFVSNWLISHRFRADVNPTRTLVAPRGFIHPQGRWFHASAWDSERQSVWLFGGRTVAVGNCTHKQFCGDLWEYRTVSSQWVEYGNMKRTPAAGWGQSMVCHDRKLWLFGGSDMRTGDYVSKSMWIMDIADVKDMQWVRLKLPQQLVERQNGGSLVVVEHPMVGPRILFVGGCSDGIYKSLGFTADLIVEQIPSLLTSMTMLSLNPRSLSFEEIEMPCGLANMSYHGTAILGKDLFLIGGLNHSINGERSYCRDIVKIDIFKAIGDAERMSMPMPISVTGHRVRKCRSYREYEDMVNNESMKFAGDARMRLLSDMMNAHVAQPYPIEDFTFIGPHPCMNAIIHNRLGRVDISKVAHCWSRDLVSYLYTGCISPEESNYKYFADFAEFIIFCWKNSMYRLIWLEMCVHIHEMFVYELLILACTTNKGVLFIEDENMGLVKHMMLRVLADDGVHLTDEDIDAVPNVSAISEYLMPLLGDVPVFDIGECPRLLETTVFNDLAWIFPSRSITCIDSVARVAHGTTYFDDEFAAHVCSNVVYAVANLQIEPILRNGCDEMLYVSAVQLLNTSPHELSAELVDDFLFKCEHRVEVRVREWPEMKQHMYQLLGKVRHRSILDAVLRVLGMCTTHMISDRDGNEIAVDPSLFVSRSRFDRLKFDVAPGMLSVVALVLYIGSSPSELPEFIDRNSLAETVFTVFGDYPCLFSADVVRPYRQFIVDTLIRDVRIEDTVIVDNLIRLYRLGIMRPAIECSRSLTWIPLVLQRLKHIEDRTLIETILSAVNMLNSNSTLDQIAQLFDSSWPW